MKTYIGGVYADSERPNCEDFCRQNTLGDLKLPPRGDRRIYNRLKYVPSAGIEPTTLGVSCTAVTRLSYDDHCEILNFNGKSMIKGKNRIGNFLRDKNHFVQ